MQSPGRPAGSDPGTKRTAAATRGTGAIAVGIRQTLDRAIVAVRIAAALNCVVLIALTDRRYARPWLGWVVAAAILIWTALATRWQLRRPFARVALLRTGRHAAIAFVVADIMVVGVLTLATLAVQSHAQIDGGMATLTTVWAVAPALTAGARDGIRAGLAAALVQGVLAVVVRGAVDGTTVGSVLLLIFAACATGYAARLASQADAVTRGLVAQQAATGERERLAREVHDGVLQVLAYVHRRGAEIGGETAALSRLAGEQETALRGLVNAAHASDGGDDAPAVDVCVELIRLRSDAVTVSTPGAPVPVPALIATEIRAAVAAALDNVRLHAGPAARAWVLLEDEEGALVVTVRDDGVGIPAGRLAEAAAAARMGVSSSIVGRIAALGGTATVTSALDGGTEVEMTVPLTRGAREHG